LRSFDSLIGGDVARFDANTTHPDLAVVLDERTNCMLVRQFYHKSTTLQIGSQKTTGRTFVHYTEIKPLIDTSAVHLSTAWLPNEEFLRTDKSPLRYVCADERLIAITQTEGLITDNPNQYP
jgi:hypothetical protein